MAKTAFLRETNTNGASLLSRARAGPEGVSSLQKPYYRMASAAKMAPAAEPYQPVLGFLVG